MAGRGARGAGAALGGIGVAAGLGGVAASRFPWSASASVWPPAPSCSTAPSADDRQQARAWLREVLGEARAALSDEIMHRFTDLQYALTLALDEAIERRLEQLDAHIAEIDKAMAEDKAERTAKRAALQGERDTLRARIKQLDEVLVQGAAGDPDRRRVAGGAGSRGGRVGKGVTR